VKRLIYSTFGISEKKKLLNDTDLLKVFGQMTFSIRINVFLMHLEIFHLSARHTLIVFKVIHSRG
jgi:hypothetical protein